MFVRREGLFETESGGIARGEGVPELVDVRLLDGCVVPAGGLVLYAWEEVLASFIIVNDMIMYLRG